MRTCILAILALGLAGCLAAREGSPRDESSSEKLQSSVDGSIHDSTHFAGVDSTVAQRAAALADSSFVNHDRQQQASGIVAAGRTLVVEADSLLSVGEDLAFLKEPFGPDTTSIAAKEAAVEAFNEGARVLERYADEADSLQAAALLDRAQVHFEQALRINPFDDEARFWLGRVYTIRASRLDAAEEYEKTLEVLQRMAWMNEHEHDIFAALATTHEHLGQWTRAAALWQRAARIALDDVELSPEGLGQPDSSLIMTYYVRSERAYVEVGDSRAALQALREAKAWAVTPDDRALIKGERTWILWDDGNLETRKTWDRLLSLSSTEPEAATRAVEAFLAQVESLQAAREVRHHLGLLYYKTGDPLRAAETLQALWHDLRQAHLAGEAQSTEFIERVRENYGTVTYNLALSSFREGDLRAALAYLLQSEETGFSQAGRAAFEAARLLRNNVDRALEAAHRAEARIKQLQRQEQKELLRYMVELYRRKGDREAALNYVQKYRALAAVP